MGSLYGVARYGTGRYSALPVADLASSLMVAPFLAGGLSETLTLGGVLAVQPALWGSLNPVADLGGALIVQPALAGGAPLLQFVLSGALAPAVTLQGPDSVSLQTDLSGAPLVIAPVLGSPPMTAGPIWSPDALCPDPAWQQEELCDG